MAVKIKNTKKCLLLFVSAALVFVVGCSGLNTPRTPDVKTQLMPPRKSAEALPGLKPLAEIKPKAGTQEKLPFETKLFSLTTSSAPLRDAVLGLAKEAELNLIFDKDVDTMTPVTVELKNLPLKKALELILDSSGYFYKIDGNVLNIKSLETRIFTFDYPLISNTAETEVGGDMLGSGSGGSGGSGGSSDISGEFTVESEMEDDDVDVWEQIKTVLGAANSGGEGQSLLSPAGTCQINPIAGTIVVTDKRKNLDFIQQYLDQLERSLKRQVIIEAKIIEVSLNKGHQFGVDWNYVNRSLGKNGAIGMSSKLRANTSGFNFAWVGTSGLSDLSFFLDAISTCGNANILSAPRLNVLNNQTSMISVGNTIPYAEWQLTEVDDRDGSGSSYRPVPTIEFVQAGVTLGVTPQISEDGVTTLHIVPIITDHIGDKTFNYEDAEWDVPIIAVRETSTIVRAQDGETVVIGGLITEKTSDTSSRIPIVGDIPWLGKAFSNQKRSNEKVELVILLTPTITNR